MIERTQIYALNANPKLATAIARKLNIPVGNCEVRYFADGECLARPLDNVRGKEVYVIQSTAHPGSQNLMELLIFLDALKRADVKTINCVIPYFGYARQDRIAQPGEPITAKLVADCLQVAGADRIITIDLHTPQIQGFFNIPVNTLSVIPTFALEIKKYMDRSHILGKEIVVVSPDHGSANRARDLATNILDSTIAIIDKRRPEPNQAEVLYLIGEVKGKHAIIIDDIIDTGGTVVAASNALKKAGAISVSVAATHGIFSLDALKRIEEIGLSALFVTNSIEREYQPQWNSTVYIVDISDLLVEIIDHIARGLPIDERLLSYY